MPTGEFVIQGDKNFLAPAQIALGLGVLFQISKESVKNHGGDGYDGSGEREHTENTKDINERHGEDGDEKEEEQNNEADKNEQQEEEEEKKEEEEKEEEKEEGEKKEKEEEGKKDEEETREEQEVEDQEKEEEAEQRSVSDTQSNIREGSFLYNPLKPRTSLVADGDDRKTSTEQEGTNTLEKQDTDETEEKEPTASEGPAAATRPETKGHFSTRERRSTKKGKATEQQSPATNSAHTNKSTPAPPTRGKKSRGKKAAAKYADQDEEERELALRLLGANKSAKTRKAATEVANKADRAREAERQKQRRRAQHDRAAEAEKKRQAIFEQGAADEDEGGEETLASEAADLAWLPALVGRPLPEDEILAAIPVCAPSAALNRYRYRVKLLPGTVKKGKAVREIVGRWIAETAATGKAKKEYAEDAGISLSSAEKLSAREGELLKGWKDTEIINCVPVGGVRIAFPGGGGSGRGDGKKGSKGGKGGKKK